MNLFFHFQRLHLNGLCKFLISDTHKGENPRSLFIYKRWIPRIYTVKGNIAFLRLLQGLAYLADLFSFVPLYIIAITKNV